MTNRLSPETQQRWIWWVCATTFVIGLGAGWWNIHEETPAPVGPPVIAASNLDQIILAHPFPDQPPAPSPGKLRIRLYPNVDLREPSFAEVVQPVAFGLDTPWFQVLWDKKLPNLAHTFSARMNGQIRFSAPVTHMHIRSDNGYKVFLRDAQGKTSVLDNWGDDVTYDFLFQVTAEPGCYEIEIDYNNYQGNGFFDLWSEEGDITYYPAPAAAAPAKSEP